MPAASSRRSEEPSCGLASAPPAPALAPSSPPPQTPPPAMPAASSRRSEEPPRGPASVSPAPALAPSSSPPPPRTLPTVMPAASSRRFEDPPRGLASVSGAEVPSSSSTSVVHRLAVIAKVVAAFNAHHHELARENLVSWIENQEKTMQSSGPKYRRLPAWDIVYYPDLLERIWGWKRLYPTSNRDYLKEYYRRNATQSAAITDHCKPKYVDQDPAILCLKKERELVSEWMKFGIPDDADVVEVSESIQGICSEIFVSNIQSGKTAKPAVADCIKCITKEAELILERLSKGLTPYDKDNATSNKIRKNVSYLAMYYCMRTDHSYSFGVGSILLGITYEAELVCEKLRLNEDMIDYEVVLNRSIRRGALGVLCHLDQYRSAAAAALSFDFKMNQGPASGAAPDWYRYKAKAKRISAAKCKPQDKGNAIVAVVTVATAAAAAVMTYKSMELPRGGLLLNLQ